MKMAAARTWKSLSSKIHPPLPMSPQDSQRLLSVLNTSFKQQLDREHTSASSSNEHHADIHLHSILTNPLFDAKPRTRASPGAKRQKSRALLGQLQNHIERPMDAFKERVSQGTADLESAKLFLKFQNRICCSSSAATLSEALRSSGAGSIMLQWLWASGMEDTGSFLKDEAFVFRLMPFLVAEAQYSRAVRWLYQLHTQEGTSYSSLRGLNTNLIKANLFEILIKAEIRFGNGLESAIKLFLRILAGFQNAGLPESSNPYDVIKAAWALTCSMRYLPETAWPKPAVIRPFLATMRKINNDPCLSATLCAYFQEPPDPRPALTYFQNTSGKELGEISSVKQRYIVLLGLKTAELFLQDGRQSQALWVMGFLRTNFAKEIGWSMDLTGKRLVLNESEYLSREDERSLQLLDALAVL